MSLEDATEEQLVDFLDEYHEEKISDQEVKELSDEIANCFESIGLESAKQIFELSFTLKIPKWRRRNIYQVIADSDIAWLKK